MAQSIVKWVASKKFARLPLDDRDPALQIGASRAAMNIIAIAANAKRRSNSQAGSSESRLNYQLRI
jgi:hypothetical protein